VRKSLYLNFIIRTGEDEQVNALSVKTATAIGNGNQGSECQENNSTRCFTNKTAGVQSAEDRQAAEELSM